MKNIGLFGSNLSAATHKVLNAATPAEKRFRAALINNDEAREVVDKVDFVRSQMEALDGQKQDTNGQENAVSVKTQAKQLGSFRRWLGAANAPVEAITTQAPPSSSAPTVEGSLSEAGMQVRVSDDNISTSFELRQNEDGTRVYRAGDHSVTMLSDGALLLA